MSESGTSARIVIHRFSIAALFLTLANLAAISACSPQEKGQPIVYVKHLEPPRTYNVVARAGWLKGTVLLTVRIAPDGTVTTVGSSPGQQNLLGYPLLREEAERIVKSWTFGCIGCNPNEPFETNIKFEYRLRDGAGVPYDDTTVQMNLPGEVIITASPLQCDHCPVERPEWCKALPRPEYKTLKRVKVSDPWFEVYKVAPGTFAIYEPHQSEETIGYLILGSQKAILFDTGMGISDVHKLVTELLENRTAKAGGVKPPLQVVVLNSHTHDDHVGGNWQFDNIYSMDTDFSRQNAKGSVEDALAEIATGEICGNLPQFFNGRDYRTQPWHISKYIHDGEIIDLGGRSIEILSTPGHTPDAITLFDRANGLLFTGDTYYPAPIWLYRPETDLDAYAKSIARLAALTPQVKVVLGAHNVPVAPPSVLPNLVTAFADLRAGKATCKPQGAGKQLCTVDPFQFLVHAN